MASVAAQYLLSATQMATFAVDGFLFLDGFVPQELNERVYADMRKNPQAGGRFWAESAPVREVFDLPGVKGIIQSLLGQNPVYDHSHLHLVQPGQKKAQAWHQDSLIDTRVHAFDVQAFYFPHDTPIEMGPTLVLPGSHLRRTNNFSIGRYKNILGQIQLAGKAGTLGFLHHGIWHCAMPNRTDNLRYMFKLRLRPGQPQRGLFDLTGHDGPDVAAIFRRRHEWQGSDESRIESLQRAKFWRYLTGDDRVDVSMEGALTRMGITL